MPNPGVPGASITWRLLEVLAIPRRLRSYFVSFHGVCFSFDLHWWSSDLPILGWHFGHEGNYHKARHAACSQEKKAVGDCQRKQESVLAHEELIIHERIGQQEMPGYRRHYEKRSGGH